MAIDDNVSIRTGFPTTDADLIGAIVIAFEKISAIRKETIVEDDHTNTDAAAEDIAVNILKNRKQFNRTISNPTAEGVATPKDRELITPKILEMIYHDRPKIIATSSNTEFSDRTKFLLDNEVE